MSYKEQLGAMARGLVGNLKRTEEFKVTMVMDHKLGQKYKQELEKLPMFTFPTTVEEGDTLIVNYILGIEYWGAVVETLGALERILNDPGVVRTITTKELKHRSCLIQKILIKLQKIEKKA